MLWTSVVLLAGGTANAQVTIISATPGAGDDILKPLIIGVVGVVGVFLSAMIALWGTRYVVDRQVLIRHVTEERAKWRERIRGLAAELELAARTNDCRQLAIIHTSMKLSLSPQDARDQRIVELVREASEKREGRGIKIAEAVTLLADVLKHDWDRAKVEAGDGTWQQRHAWRRGEKRRKQAAECKQCLERLEASEERRAKPCGCPSNC